MWPGMLVSTAGLSSWLAGTLQQTEVTTTPLWLIVLLLLLMVLLFWWGSTRPGLSPASQERQAAAVPEGMGPETAVRDDLKRIEGIGPRIEQILNEAGILTFAALADSDVDLLKKIVREDAGITIADPGTWPEQASLAAEGQWEALKMLQDRLKGGRYV